jgi:hypothetical protein
MFGESGREFYCSTIYILTEIPITRVTVRNGITWGLQFTLL